MTKKYTTEIRDEQGEWIERPFDDVRKGDIFRQTNPLDNKRVVAEGGEIFKAETDPYFNKKNKAWTVEAYPIYEEYQE